MTNRFEAVSKKEFFFLCVCVWISFQSLTFPSFVLSSYFFIVIGNGRNDTICLGEGVVGSHAWGS